MTKIEDKQTPEAISEIIKAEQKRAKELTENPIFRDWVRLFRESYIVKGFLTPLYARDGKHSRSRRRVSELGKYILSWDMYGKEFQEGPQGRVKRNGFPIKQFDEMCSSVELFAFLTYL